MNGYEGLQATTVGTYGNVTNKDMIASWHAAEAGMLRLKQDEERIGSDKQVRLMQIAVNLLRMSSYGEEESLGEDDFEQAAKFIEEQVIPCLVPMSVDPVAKVLLHKDLDVDRGFEVDWGTAPSKSATVTFGHYSHNYGCEPNRAPIEGAADGSS
jgi:hypothetical protein